MSLRARLSICLAVVSIAFAFSSYFHLKTVEFYQAALSQARDSDVQIANLRDWGLGTVVVWAKQKETLEHMDFLMEIHDLKHNQIYEIRSGGAVRIKNKEPVLLKIN